MEHDRVEVLRIRYADTGPSLKSPIGPDGFSFTANNDSAHKKLYLSVTVEI